MKLCTKCNIEKDESNFSKSNSKKDGLYAWCKNCAKAYRKVNYELNREVQLQRGRDWRKLNPDKHKQCFKNWVEKNKEKYTKSRKEYRSRPKSKQRKLELDRLYYRRNSSNPIFKLKRLLNNKLRRNVHKIKIDSYTKKSLQFLGCTIDQFKLYIESQFKEGMSWSNYGFYGWHIDHKLPISSFDLTKDEDIIKCFHYTNLQPLWAAENLLKRDKILNEYL